MVSWALDCPSTARRAGVIAAGPPTGARLDALNQSYWELRYDYTRLRSQVARLDPRSPGPEPAAAPPPSMSFVPLSSIRKKERDDEGIRNLHTWRSLMANEYDVVVIGSGTGGYVAAIRAAQLGLRTAVVERAPVLGGTCLNWGCIPTKALLEHAHALKIAQDWKEWGLTIGEAAIGLDMAQVQARKDKIVKGLTGGVELLFKKNKIDWIKGSGRLAGQRQSRDHRGPERRRSARRKRSSSPPARSRAACRASRSIASGSSRATRRSA